MKNEVRLSEKIVLVFSFLFLFVGLYVVQGELGIFTSTLGKATMHLTSGTSHGYGYGECDSNIIITEECIPGETLTPPKVREITKCWNEDGDLLWKREKIIEEDHPMLFTSFEMFAHPTYAICCHRGSEPQYSDGRPISCSCPEGEIRHFGLEEYNSGRHRATTICCPPETADLPYDLVYNLGEPTACSCPSGQVTHFGTQQYAMWGGAPTSICCGEEIDTITINWGEENIYGEQMVIIYYGGTIIYSDVNGKEPIECIGPIMVIKDKSIFETEINHNCGAFSEDTDELYGIPCGMLSDAFFSR